MLYNIVAWYNMSDTKNDSFQRKKLFVLKLKEREREGVPRRGSTYEIYNIDFKAVKLNLQNKCSAYKILEYPESYIIELFFKTYQLK